MKIKRQCLKTLPEPSDRYDIQIFIDVCNCRSVGAEDHMTPHARGNNRIYLELPLRGIWEGGPRFLKLFLFIKKQRGESAPPHSRPKAHARGDMKNTSARPAKFQATPNTHLAFECTLCGLPGLDAHADCQRKSHEEDEARNGARAPRVAHTARTTRSQPAWAQAQQQGTHTTLQSWLSLQSCKCTLQSLAAAILTLQTLTWIGRISFISSLFDVYESPPTLQSGIFTLQSVCCTIVILQSLCMTIYTCMSTYSGKLQRCKLTGGGEGGFRTRFNEMYITYINKYGKISTPGGIHEDALLSKLVRLKYTVSSAGCPRRFFVITPGAMLLSSSCT